VDEFISDQVILCSSVHSVTLTNNLITFKFIHSNNTMSRTKSTPQHRAPGKQLHKAKAAMMKAPATVRSFVPCASCLPICGIHLI
jgi:hypothetical protein